MPENTKHPRSGSIFSRITEGLDSAIVLSHTPRPALDLGQTAGERSVSYCGCKKNLVIPEPGSNDSAVENRFTDQPVIL